uniref:Sushi domain-containing protein n=1 Tax=Taeniopygia guttata TaxID=59729 RepID=A0A674GTP1_TAEGU
MEISAPWVSTAPEAWWSLQLIPSQPWQAAGTEEHSTPAMKAGAPGWGGPPGPPGCGAASDLPVLLLAVLGLLSVPEARGSCSVPPRLRFAALSKEDERRNFFPVGTNVSYICRPGYENTSESSPSSTCLENLTWSQPAELCRRRSCGTPGALPGGRMGPLMDLHLGARVEVFCEPGYKLVGNNFIWCQLEGNDVEWSKLPTCELITCSPPPPISHGRHDGEGIEIFPYNSTVTYSCDPKFQLVGNGSIQCGSRDKTSGVWSGATPECKEKSSAARLGAKATERRAPPKSPQGNGTQPSKKALTWERKLSLYKKALQNTISPSQSSSFLRKPVSTNWAASEFRFVLPLYKSPKSYSVFSKGSVCPPKYMGILPPPGCFQKLKWPKFP